MGWNWRSKVLGTVGVAAVVVGAGLVVAAPASAAPVADADALREAVSNLNGAGPTDEIELAPGVKYTLPGAAGCKNEDSNASGDLDIARSNPIKIFTPDGQPPAVLEMTCDSASSPQRVIQVLRGKLTLRNVVVRNGHAPTGTGGGGVQSAGEVAVENASFEGNTAGAGKDGTTAGDQCTGAAGGEGGFGGQGGAVLAMGGLTVSDSTFASNLAGNGGNGGNGSCGKPGGAGGDGGSGGYGGAVQCGVVIDGNAQGCQGPMTVRGSTFNGNASGNGGNGGNGGAGQDGAVGGAGGTGGASEGNAFGGAVLFIGGRNNVGPTTLLVENSTLDGNASGNGGNGGNGAAGGTGGDAGDGGAGGIAGAIVAGFAGDSNENVATLVHVTATDNAAGGAGGTPGQPGGATVDGVVAAGQPGEPGDTGGGSVAFLDPWTSVASVIGTSDPAGDGPDCWTKAANSNLSRSTDADTEDNGCGFGAGSVAAMADYALMPLSDNGGRTQTRLPAPTSSLVDKVTGVPGQLTVDQRGVARPQAAGADIGAAEIQLIDPKVTKTASASSVAPGTEVTFTITVANNGTSSPKPGVTVADPKCPNVSTPTGDANTNNTLDPGETYTYTCKLTLAEAGTFTNSVTATVTDGAGVPISRTASVDVTVTGGGAGGGAPPLAKTGANNPTPELMLGAWLIAGGLVLVLIARRRRARVRVPRSDG